MIQIDRNPSPIKLRQFSAVLVLLSTYLIAKWFWGQSGLRAPASVASPAMPGLWFLFALGSAGIIFPKIARFPFLALSYATFPVGLVFSYAVLFVVYFLMIAPTGIWMRLSGRDRLGLRNWNQAGSRWNRRKPNSDLTYYLRQ